MYDNKNWLSVAQKMLTENRVLLNEINDLKEIISANFIEIGEDVSYKNTTPICKKKIIHYLRKVRK